MTYKGILTLFTAALLSGSVALSAGAASAAAADPGARPASAGVTAAAVEDEIDFSTPGTPPDDVVCGDFDWTNSALACWEPYGDVVWVLNYGSQAVGWWWNYRNGTLYRQGKCVNNHGDWGYCNKNMYEGSELRFRACTSTDQVYRECSAIVRSTA